jgi:predicted nucleic acid-binding protein
MNAVFLDTAGMLALWDDRDQWHSRGEKAFQALMADRTRLVTSSFVLLECGNAAARRPYRQAVVRLRESLEQSHALVAPTDDDWRKGWLAYESGDAESAGLVDQVSFAIMRRLKLTTAFTHDKHFRAAGFQILL